MNRVAECLARIDELNPALNAFITVVRDARGSVPVAIKDFYDTAGIRTTGGAEEFRDRVPSKDAASVAALKRAGAAILGKTNMHRLGMGTTGLDSAFGPVRNPWNPMYIAGGSSSGSAAAIASAMCDATLDTDAVGSCRLPAACCGVVGFKGTYGLVSTQGILGDAPPPDPAILWLSHAAITTRSVVDTVRMLEILANRKFSLDGNVDVRIGIANNFQADDEVRVAFEKGVAMFDGKGVRAPLDVNVMDVSNIERERATFAFDAGVDVLFLPTTTTTVLTIEAARGNSLALSPANTAFANYYGLPAISVPCGFDANGLPIGLQIVGKWGADETVLRLAHAFQMSRPPSDVGFGGLRP